MLSDLSYIIYLLHWAGAEYVGEVGGTPQHRLPYLAAAVAIVFAVSILIWRFNDRPIDALRSAWVQKHCDPARSSFALGQVQQEPI